jgi:hypothetical protein
MTARLNVDLLTRTSFAAALKLLCLTMQAKYTRWFALIMVE